MRYKESSLTKSISKNEKSKYIVALEKGKSLKTLGILKGFSAVKIIASAPFSSASIAMLFAILTPSIKTPCVMFQPDGVPGISVVAIPLSLW